MSPQIDLRRPFRPRVEALEPRALLSVCLVDRLTDLGEGKELVGDLRYCIQEAQDKDSIQFAVQGTINLTRALPDLTRSISIEGPGADLLTVRRDTGGDYRIFRVSSGTTVNISGLTIANGWATQGGGIYVAGGIVAVNNVTLTGNLALGPSRQDGRGGGMYIAGGTVTLTDSTFSGNGAGGGNNYAATGVGSFGGGLYVASGTVSVNRSTLVNNVVVANGSFNGGKGKPADPGDPGRGGGIYVASGTVDVSASTLRNNVAAGGNGGTAGAREAGGGSEGGQGAGGGFYIAGGTGAVYQSTLSTNYANGGVGGAGGDAIEGIEGGPGGNGGAGMGGSVYVAGGAMAVYQCTLTSSRALGGPGGPGGSGQVPGPDGIAGQAYGGGVFNGGGTLTTWNTMIARNAALRYPDVDGALASLGYNLIGNTQGGSGYDKTDLLDVDPLLGELQDNGGPTLTHALLPGSPALDAGDPTDAPEWDQRGEGFYRIAGKNIDIGAYEEQGGAAPRAVDPPGGVIAAGIDAGALLLLETQARPAWESPNKALQGTGPGFSWYHGVARNQ